MSASSAFQRRQTYKITLFCLLLIPFCSASDWRYEETHTESRAFTSGGYMHVRLSVGDVHIRRGDSNTIRLEYTVKSRRESRVKEAHVDFDVRGNEATLEFHAPGGGNTQFDVELEVPAKTHLDVNQKVGDMSIENIEGDKDLSLGVGDIRVSAEHSGYRLVKASTGVGDVNSDGYGEPHGWLGKTLRYEGEGRYELRAHVGVGDVRLEQH